MGDSIRDGIIYNERCEQARRMREMRLTWTQIAEYTGLNPDALIALNEDMELEKREPFQKLSDKEVNLLTAFRELKFKGKRTVLMVANQLAYGEDWDDSSI